MIKEYIKKAGCQSLDADEERREKVEGERKGRDVFRWRRPKERWGDGGGRGEGKVMR